MLPEEDESDTGPKLELLLACKQINVEAKSIAYSKIKSVADENAGLF